MRLTCVLGLTAVLLFVPPAGLAQECPGVDPESGFPIAAASTIPSVDSMWLASVARAAAYRWQVPSRRRDTYRGWERVQRRTLPPEPRWADDWSPGNAHRAQVRVTLHRDPRRHAAAIVQESGDKVFDRTLTTVAGDPMPGSPAFPDLPAGVSADSIDVMLSFGFVPEGGTHGVIRFAAVQSRMILDRSSLRVMRPAGHRGRFPAITVKYDVNVAGRVEPGSIEFVRSSGGTYESAVRDGLLGARFQPPTSNCRAVAQTVVQTFGN